MKCLEEANPQKQKVGSGCVELAGGDAGSDQELPVAFLHV